MQNISGKTALIKVQVAVSDVRQQLLLQQRVCKYRTGWPFD